MFSSYMNNSPSLRTQAQEIAQNKRLVEEYRIYHNLIDIAATEMIVEFDKLKSALEIAATAYLNNKPKLFRHYNKQKAQTFKDKLAEATNMLELIPALQEAIKKGDEYNDSLKTFLFKSVYSSFSMNNIIKAYPYSELTYTKFLEDIIMGIKKQLEPICLKTLSDSSGVGMVVKAVKNR